MTAQPLRKRLLSALLLVGLAAATTVAAAHSTPTPPSPPDATQDQPAEGEEHGGHDPASCSLCSIAPAFGHALLVASPSSLSSGVEADRRSIHAKPAPHERILWARSASRAPPFPPSI
ncbi:MAG: hypothetical protein ACQGVK_05740 [Myxococcota bacterium]